MKKLAINGGSRTIDPKKARYQWPPITKKMEKEVIGQLHEEISIYNKSGIFEIFENQWAKFHQRSHALLCSSGTQAIHTMFVAADLKSGDEVICPAYTFFATVTPLFFTGAKPVLADCDQFGNIDPQEIEKKINKKTKAVIITHMWGMPCQMDKIVGICKKYKLLLLEDCSHAHGATYKGKPLGSFGDMAAWSIQGPKNITGGEGGVFVCDNNEFYYRALLVGHYNKRCKVEIPKDHPLAKFAVTGMGMKYRAHPIAVRIAYEIFKDLKKHLSTRAKFAKKIYQELKGTKGVVLPKLPGYIKPSWYALVYQYKGRELKNLVIDKYFKALQAEGLAEIDQPGSTKPLNLLPLFQEPTKLFPSYKKFPFHYRPGDFPRAENFFNNAIKMPVWAFPTDASKVTAYIKAIKKVSTNYQELL